MRTVRVVAILIAAGFGPVMAQTGEWMTDSRSACSVWDPLPVPDEIIGWTGDCKDGKASGSGVLAIFRLGNLVERNEGEFVDGKQTGLGVRENRRGRYIGSFRTACRRPGHLRLDRRHALRGRVEERQPRRPWHAELRLRLRYEGQFRANSYSGLGSMILPNGARYEGEYELNTPHGTGVYRSVDGSVYAGRWTHGCFRHDGKAAHLFVPAEDLRTCRRSRTAPGRAASLPDRSDSWDN
jgi:hypothetical protein